MAIDKVGSTPRPQGVQPRGERRQQPKSKARKKPPRKPPEGRIDERA